MDIEELIEALDNYSSARQEYRECRESCEHDAGYFCWRHEKAWELAAKELADKLNAYIDERVDARIEAAVKNIASSRGSLQ